MLNEKLIDNIKLRAKIEARSNRWSGKMTIAILAVCVVLGYFIGRAVVRMLRGLGVQL